MALTYKQSGVNIDAGNELVDRIRPALDATSRSELIGSVGGFAALVNVPRKFKTPVIVTSTDGVGTKLELAMQFNRHREIGFDLVGMCVNDVLVYGAEPFLFLDYFATGKLDVDVAEQVIIGIAEACKFAGCALPGGETAEMPGLYADGVYDLAGFCIGMVDEHEIVDPKNVTEGNLLIGLESDGPHSNGYSLIRNLLSNVSEDDGPTQQVMDQLLAPTKIYTRAVLSTRTQVNGMAHITGGGFLENVPRMLPKHLTARIDLSSWSPHECFRWIQEKAELTDEELFRTFNCGIAYVLSVTPERVDSVTSKLTQSGERPHLIGEIVKDTEVVTDSQLLLSNQGYRFG